MFTIYGSAICRISSLLLKYGQYWRDQITVEKANDEYDTYIGESEGREVKQIEKKVEYDDEKKELEHVEIM